MQTIKQFDYSQQSAQGCLVVCLHYLLALEPNCTIEKELLLSGLFAQRDSHLAGILGAFFAKYRDLPCGVRVYVDNKYYHQQLSSSYSHESLEFVTAKCDVLFLESTELPFVAYVDRHSFGAWDHAPHFVLVTNKTERYFRVFDPWYGKDRVVSKSKFMTSINSLRNLRVCPVIISRNTV